jgi:cystathionine gamma-synthase
LEVVIYKAETAHNQPFSNGILELAMADGDDKKPHPETLAAQALGRVDAASGGLIPPVHISTTYERDGDNKYSKGLIYARPHNPTTRQAEEVVAALEGGADAMAFASGMAAAIAVFDDLRAGDHVVAPNVMYWALRVWLGAKLAGRGVDVTFVDMASLEALESALRSGKSRIVWIETPANPLWTITDIARAADLTHGAGARLVVDSTVATPVFTNPIAYGADIVMHSATKYLNGHSDVLAGVLVTRAVDEAWDEIASARSGGGAILGPQQSALLLRGMRTLHVRVRAATKTAHRIADHFNGHGRVDSVLYPGLAGHPGHDVAARQMQGGFGAMLSLRIRGGERAAIAAAARVKVWKRATSLGGVESLIEHRASVEGAGSPVPTDLLRLSVGLEHIDDLIEDLEQALDFDTG